ncbi:MAG: hypothetical protein QF615_14625 [Planctomycetota bacterium]|jgi:hypothetical protein|nr:hypothetical protein [Planctomycetota bacterium]MDP6370840.1 hypothetical protein [Planctomycetota bacterium]
MKTLALMGSSVMVALLSACQSVPAQVDLLATAQVASDFDTYSLERVGQVPFAGPNLDHNQANAFQQAFFAEFSGNTPFEIVPLSVADLAEIQRSDPYRRGYYRTHTIIELSRRFQLDGILIGTVTAWHPFPPQRLAVQVDLLSAETGMVIWSSAIHLDASDLTMRENLRAWYDAHPGEAGESWELALLSPRRFIRFAAWQIGRLL